MQSKVFGYMQTLNFTAVTTTKKYALISYLNLNLIATEDDKDGHFIP
jgi:hypothetical protein